MISENVLKYSFVYFKQMVDFLGYKADNSSSETEIFSQF